MQQLVVIGNGMVGHRLVQAVLDLDTAHRWRVTVLGGEPRPAYDRVALSSYVDGTTAEELTLPELGVEVHLGDPATSIDRDARVVHTASGRALPYDALVLATGSVPFVPPVPGKDLPGCFVYRTLDDLDAITEAAAAAVARPGPGRRSAVVVEGGLLGLEAARALRSLGLSPQVVEIAPRLMPVQVDEGGGALLRRLVESSELAVRCGVSVNAIAQDRRRLTATLSDGVELDADLVVFSAGIRPADALARAAGLAMGERGGVFVDDRCRTSDERVWAIGEVAALEGRCYGLVAPGYAMAEVVADRLLGGASTMTPPDMSTQLKMLGVDVASFGDAHAATPGALEVVVNDPVAGTYSKLVVSDDARSAGGDRIDGARTLLGGVLVGDASRYASLRPRSCWWLRASRSRRRCASTSDRAAPSCTRWSRAPGSGRSPSWSPATAAAGAATSASPPWRRSWRVWGRDTCTTASRPPCRTPTTTSWPTCSATAPTRWSRGYPAARSAPCS